MQQSTDRRVLSDSQRVASCVGCSEIDFKHVVASPDAADRLFGRGSWKTVTWERHSFQVSEWAVADPERLVVELMYRFLHEPIPFGANNLHGQLPFQNLMLTSDGQFKLPGAPGMRPDVLNGMPDARAIIQMATEQLGMETDRFDVRPLIQVMKEALPNR